MIVMSTDQHVNAYARKRYTVPPERVFAAWLEPKLIGQWMFGPRLREEEVLRISVDARVGGRFSFLVRRDGEELDHVGTYLEIEPQQRLIFTWGIGEPDGKSRVIVEFVRTPDGGCETTLTHEMDPEWTEYIDRTEKAWTKMMDALAELL
jgi:uncharacterized protein YndB with AHSA1/START domain